MSVASPVYFEIVDFIAAGTTPQAVIDFRPSPEAQQRVTTLIEREKADTLSPEEEAELNHFMELEHILRMAKARARKSSLVASDVSEELRTEVARRSGQRCEYCLIHEGDAGFPHQVDHIVSRKHGGWSAFRQLGVRVLGLQPAQGK